MDKARLGGLVTVLVAATACGSLNKVVKAPMGAAASASTCTFASAATPVGGTGSGAALALAKVDGRRIAFVADEDAKAILTVDLDTRQEIAQTPLAGRPSQVLVSKDGRIFVTLRDDNQLVVLGATRASAPLETHCHVTTPAEPIALAASPDEAMIVVTSASGETLTAFDGTTLAATFQTKLPREPRSVVVSDDGKTAFVSHAVGGIMSAVNLGGNHELKTVVMRGWMAGEQRLVAQRRKEAAAIQKTDAASGKMMFDEIAKEEAAGRLSRPSCQGFALAKSVAIPGRIFAPQVMVEPGDPESRPDGYGDENQSTESASIAVVDEDAREPFPSSVVVANDMRGVRELRDPRPECLLPRAAAIDPQTKSLLVTCFGIDAVIAYDAASPRPLNAEKRRWTVGAGPTGVAVDGEKRRAVVWSQFDRTLSTFAIGGNEIVDEKVAHQVVQKTAMNANSTKLSPDFALGRILFHAAGDNRISADGRACASCHPDGRDDAITWATPEGPRRTVTLAGRASKTPPYSWNGNEATLHNHLGNTFDRLSGKGLRSIELDALVTYLTQMPAGQALTLDKAKVDRGRAIFTSAETRCASCHSGANFTDGQNHDIGSKNKFDREGAFNTPSLHLVGGAGPYFHDGRYATLGELLVKSDGTMGRTKHLSKDDMESLETFLRSL